MRHPRPPAALLVTLLAACSSGGNGGTDPGTIALSLSPTSASVQQGANTAVAATLTRAGGFTGTVALTVTGQPSGVTAAVSNVQTSGSVTTATVTVDVGAATVPGVYPLVVHGTGSGVSEATASYTLTVTAAPTPAYTLTLSAATVSTVQGGNAPTVNVTLGRTNFTGNVTFSVDNLPAGVSAAFVPNITATSASVLTLTVAPTAAAGTTNLTVRGVATGLTDRTAPLALTITAAGSFTLAVTPVGAVSMVQGTSNASKTIQITRTNYAPAITLTAENLPAGLTAAFAPNPAATNSSVLTLTATANLAPNTYTLTIRGTGPAALRLPGDLASVEAIVSLDVAVVSSVVGSFSLSTPSSVLNVVQAAPGNVVVNINRTGGNTSNVALTATGSLPVGMTLGFTPPSTTLTSSVLGVTTTSATPVGSYPIVIRGNTTGLAEQTTDLSIIVSAPGASGASVDFNGCPSASTPVWAAFQNGGFAAPWQVVNRVSGVYTFTINAGQGGFTYVTVGSGGSTQVNVQYLTQAEFTAGPLRFCGAAPTGRTLTGMLAGMSANHQGFVSFGNAQALVLSASPNFTLSGAASGVHDLVVYTHPGLIGASDRMGLWRDENPSSSFGTRNMATDPNAFLPMAALISITGAGGGETFTHGMNYYTGGTCDIGSLYLGMPVTGTQFNAYGAPTGMQRAGDRHGLYVQGTSGTAGNYQYRSVWQTFHDLTAHSLAMPPPLPAGTTTETGSGYSILRHQFTAPVGYNSSFSWQYTQSSAPKSATVTATFGYVGGVNVDLKIGSYSGLSGWFDSWAPTAGLHADTYATAVGGTPAGGFCGPDSEFIVAGRLFSF